MTDPLQTLPAAARRRSGRLRGPLIHPVVVGLTARDLFGRRRLILFAVLPLVLLGLAVTSRAVRGAGAAETSDILQQVGLGALLPLVALIAATGTLAPQIDDGSVVYLLSKPVSRHAIIRSQALVAYLTVVAFAVLPMVLAGVIDEGSLGPVTRALAVGGPCRRCRVRRGLHPLVRRVPQRRTARTDLRLDLGGRRRRVRPRSAEPFDTAVGSEHLRAHARRSCQGIRRRLAGRVLGRSRTPVVVTAGSFWLAGHRLRSLRLRTSD